jgi:predicted DNA-binding protein with PD1-like motif
MKYSKAEVRRIFVIRLEDGDALPSTLEKFAEDNGIAGGMCILVGGMRSGGKIVVGPVSGEEMPVNPIFLHLEGIHEIAGVGTIFPDSEGKPKLHMHASMGRKDKSVTGCIRPGIQIWQVGEVILLEIKTTGRRVKDEKTGFELLEP